MTSGTSDEIREPWMFASERPGTSELMSENPGSSRNFPGTSDEIREPRTFANERSCERPGQKLYLVMLTSKGEKAWLDVLDPRSTLNNPIIDHTKFGIILNDDDVFEKMMYKHGQNGGVQNNAVHNGGVHSNKDEFKDMNVEGVNDGDVNYENEYEETEIHVDILTDISNKITDKSITQDMTDLFVADNIKEKANEIYNKLEISTKRGGRRKKVVFFCLFQAHRELDIPCDPRILADIVGIKTNDISRAFSMCSPIETGYYPPRKRCSFMDFIPIYYHLTGLSSLNLLDVEELAKDISEKCPPIQDELPQTVAAAILMYYMDINGVSCTFNFSKTVNRSEMTLVQMKKRIEGIHNS